MNDEGDGFEIYYLGQDKFSIFNTNTKKSLEDIENNTCSWTVLQKIESIVTRNERPSYIEIKDMTSYNIENMKDTDIDYVISYCICLGQRPTAYDYFVVNDKKNIYKDTSLRILLEKDIVIIKKKEPSSCCSIF